MPVSSGFLCMVYAGFITEAYKAGARDEAIIAYSRHNDIRTIRGYIRRAKLVAESPAGLGGLWP